MRMTDLRILKVSATSALASMTTRRLDPPLRHS